MIQDGRPLFNSEQTLSGEFSREWMPLNLTGPWSETLGWSLEELLKTPFYKLIHASDLQYSITRAAVKSDLSAFQSFENRVLCKDGSYKNILWHYLPQPDSGKSLIFARDITNLKIERYLAEKSQQVARVGSWYLDFSRNQVFWSQETYSLFGVDPKTFTPTVENAFSFFDPEDLLYLQEHYSSLTSDPQNGERDTGITKGNGERSNLRLTIRVSKTGNALEGLYGTVQDISAEKEIKDHLIRAKEDAERAIRIKSDFLANISHEIRTPMNSIVGMVDLLNETNLDEEQRKFSEILARASGNLLNILNDVLDLAKLEANKLTFEQIPFSVREVIERSSNLVQSKLENKNLTLKIEISKTAPSIIIGDPSRLQQVLNNLLGNAIKFTDNGGVTVNIFSNDNQFISFEVIDTGIGIAESSLPHLFHRFFQVDSSISRRYGGTGLGLSICKELVERMGGKITAESIEGQGTTLRFTLPYSPKA
jgi:two-component system sensor histidine kinase/response regulator